MTSVAMDLTLDPNASFSVLKIIVVFAHLMCLVTVAYFPIAAWIFYLALFLVTSGQEDIWLVGFTFLAPLMAGVVAYSGYLVEALLGFLILWYGGSIDLAEGIFMPSDALATVLWRVLLGVSVSIGHVLYRVRKQRKDLLEQWDRDVEQRKKTMAHLLHEDLYRGLITGEQYRTDKKASLQINGPLGFGERVGGIDGVCTY